MEIAKFVFSSIGTFLSVFGLSFNIFQYWKKKQEENFKSLKDETSQRVKNETEARQRDISRMEKRLDTLENTLVQSMQQRMSSIEGELKGNNISTKQPIFLRKNSENKILFNELFTVMGRLHICILSLHR